MANKWDEYFLLEALFWSSKSPDTSTKCGCVLTRKDNTPVSYGYNGLMRGVEHSFFQEWINVRPDKYDFFIHAEQNAIYNAARNRHSTMDCSAFITGPPCLVCTQALWQSGCTRIVFSDFNIPKMLDNEEYTNKFDRVVESLENKVNFEFISSTVLGFSALDFMQKVKEKQ